MRKQSPTFDVGNNIIDGCAIFMQQPCGIGPNGVHRFARNANSVSNLWIKLDAIASQMVGHHQIRGLTSDDLQSQVGQTFGNQALRRSHAED